MTESFNLAHHGKLPDHYAKGTPSLFARVQLVVAWPQNLKNQKPNSKNQTRLADVCLLNVGICLNFAIGFLGFIRHRRVVALWLNEL